MLAPDIIVKCQCSVMRNFNNMISRMTNSSQDAGSMRDVKNKDKTYKVVQSIHPSCFAKGITDGKLSDKTAVRKAALLELSFCRAVHAICGTEIGGHGLDRLREEALERRPAASDPHSRTSRAPRDLFPVTRGFVIGDGKHKTSVAHGIWAKAVPMASQSLATIDTRKGKLSCNA